MSDPAELSRLSREALTASYHSRSQGLNPETINGVTQTKESIIHHLQGAAQSYRDQGHSEDQIRALVFEDIQQAQS